MVDNNQSTKKLIRLKRTINLPISEDENQNIINKAIINLLNQKDKKKITKLDRVGFKTADKIIDYINNNGPINDLNELNNINGIGEGIIEKIKNTNLEKNFNVMESVKIEKILS